MNVAALRRAWPLPAAAAAVLLLAAGITVGILKAPKADPAGPLVEAAALLEQGKHEEAVAVINQQVVPAAQRGMLSKASEAQMLSLRARALARGQVQLGIDRAENHKAIVADLTGAKGLGGMLDGIDTRLLAQSLIALGEDEKALKVIGGIESPATRQELRRVLVERAIRRGRGSDEVTMPILAETLASPEASADDKAWAMARQAELRLNDGAADEAVSTLLRALPRLDGVAPGTRAELATLLGRAYVVLARQRPNEVGLGQEAQKNFERAVEWFDGTDPRRGETQLRLARVLQGLGKIEEARDLFATVAAEQKNQPIEAPAQLGLAECAALNGDDEAAVEWYRAAFVELKEIKKAEGAALEAMGGETEAMAGSSGHEAGAAPASEGHGEAPGGGEHGAPPEHGAAPEPAAKTESAAKESESEAERPVLKKVKVRDDLAVDAPALLESLLERQSDRYLREEYERALDYAELAKEAAELEGAAGANVHLALGECHRQIGMKMLEKERTAEARSAMKAVLGAEGEGAAKAGEKPVEKADASASERARGGDAPMIATVAELSAKGHFYDAAVNFKLHSEEIVTMDAKAYGESLFSAADCFDRAAERAAAKGAFAAYVESAPDEDPRRHEARFRLGQLYQADRDYVAAIEQYRKLTGITLEIEPGKQGSAKEAAASGMILGASGGAGAGEWGDRALVPLARCLLEDTVPENDALGRAVLEDVISGRRVEPGSDLYRDAVTELGEIEYAAGMDMPRVIELLTRADAFASQPRRAVVKYKLADANRQSATEIASELKQSMPQAKRAELEEARSARLRAALNGFVDVAGELEGKGGTLTAAEGQMLRNAVFARADVVFDEGKDFAGAITLYDRAAQKYAGEVSALVARTQIVSAYVALGRWDEARRANEVAKKLLKETPDAVLADPALPMQRRHWQQWLDASAALERRGGQADASGKN